MAMIGIRARRSLRARMRRVAVEAVHHRHLHVHQDQVVRPARHGLDRRDAVGGGLDLQVERAPAGSSDQFAVDRHVLDQQQPQRPFEFDARRIGRRSARRRPRRCGAATSNQKVEPSALVGCATPISPPISSTIRLEIARPRPVPPNRREIEASAWVNRSKTGSACLGGTPMPVSLTSTRSRRGLAVGGLVNVDVDAAPGGELDGVGERSSASPGAGASHRRSAARPAASP